MFGVEVSALLAAVLAAQPRMPLVRGAAGPASLRDTIASAKVPEPARAGLYLHAGFWAEAHEVAQEIEDAEGSYWHAIVHRQEPDPHNAAYWFGRVGSHPIFPELARRAAAIDPALSGAWDPRRFIDYCESAQRSRGEAQSRAVEIQEIEWELLFDHSMRRESRS